MKPLMYLQSESMYTLQIGLRQFEALRWRACLELADGREPGGYAAGPGDLPVLPAVFY